VVERGLLADTSQQCVGMW